MRHKVWIFSLAALIGCGHEVRVIEVTPGAGGSGGAGGAGDPGTSVGSGQPDPAYPAVNEVRAPDQTSVRVQFNQDVAAHLPADPAAFVISSPEVEPLAVLALSYDEATRSLTLLTDKQKLGARYQLTLAAPGALGGLGGEFIAADTATFWAVDFATFDEYQLVADRVAVGANAVAYLEQGMFVDDAEEALYRFDNEIVPIETAHLGPPSDFDKNGRIVLLGLNGFGLYGGYFNSVDTLPDEEAVKEWGYHSNETDMVYINVEIGTFEAYHVLPHEFSHLLYQAKHGFEGEGWSWHNEGLAECAVHLVNGFNDSASQAVLFDETGAIASGLSLVNWQFGNYTQYGLAYMFWTYLAGQMQGGPDGYSALFNASGNPGAIGDLIQEKLGKTFAEAQRDFLLAMWLQEPSGPYGFEGMVTFFGETPPTVPANVQSLPLEPYAGAYFLPKTPSVDYPGTQGPNILYAGIYAGWAVDLTAPFEVYAGALVVLNANQDFTSFPVEPSGPGLFPAKSPPQKPVAAGGPKVRDRSWLHPPPFDPRRLDALALWRARTKEP